jgi:hypothetical protein
VIKYFPFFSDFGPFTLADIWNYVAEMMKIMKSETYSDAVIVHHTDKINHKRVNSALLMGCYEILGLKRSAEEVIKRWKDFKFRPYRDSSHNKCTYKCYVSFSG